MHRVEVLSKRRVYQGFNSVDEFEVKYELPDGTMAGPAKRSSVERGDAVGVLVQELDSGHFLLVRQLRVPLIRHDEPWIVEIVAGKIDGLESPEEAARREVEEEIGFEVLDLEFLTEMYGSPGGLSEKVTLFFAETRANLKSGPGGGIDEHEDVEVLTWSPGEAFERLDRGELRDAKTQIALLKVRSKFASLS